MRMCGSPDPPADGRKNRKIPDGYTTSGAPAETQPLSEEHRKEIRWYREEYVEPAKYRRQEGEPCDDPN